MRPHERVKKIREIRDLKGGPKSLLYTLATYANPENECFPSIKSLALGAGISRRAAFDAIEKLKKAGYLSAKRRKDQRYSFTLIFPSNADGQGWQKTFPRVANSATKQLKNSGTAPRTTCADCGAVFKWPWEGPLCRNCNPKVETL